MISFSFTRMIMSKAWKYKERFESNSRCHSLPLGICVIDQLRERGMIKVIIATWKNGASQQPVNCWKPIKKKLSKGVKNNWIVASLWAAYCQYIGKKNAFASRFGGANLVIFFSDFKVQVPFLRLAYDNAIIVVDTDLLQGGWLNMATVHFSNN